MGEPPGIAAERGGKEVQLAVLAATLATSIVFFPVTFLYGVSRFLFVALALAVILSSLRSYLVAMTVVPGCSVLSSFAAIRNERKLGIRKPTSRNPEAGFSGSTPGSITNSTSCSTRYEGGLKWALLRLIAAVLGKITGVFLLSLCLYPFIEVKPISPRTDPGQFVTLIQSAHRDAHRNYRPIGPAG